MQCDTVDTVTPYLYSILNVKPAQGFSTFLLTQLPFNFTASGREMHWIINSHVEASKIGRKIANQVIDYHRRFDNSSSGNYPNRNSISIKNSFPFHTKKKIVRCHRTNLNRVPALTCYRRAKTVVPVMRYRTQNMHRRLINNG